MMIDAQRYEYDSADDNTPQKAKKKTNEFKGSFIDFLKMKT